MEALEKKEQLYGVKSVHAAKNFPIMFIKNFFTLLSWKFWLGTYIFAIIIYYVLSNKTIDDHFLYILNTLLFPFSCMLLGKIANVFYPSVRFIHALLYPTSTHYLRRSSIIFKLILYIIKFFIFFIIWYYSFALGILGLIVMIIDVKNLSK